MKIIQEILNLKVIVQYFLVSLIFFCGIFENNELTSVLKLVPLYRDWSISYTYCILYVVCILFFYMIWVYLIILTKFYNTKICFLNCYHKFYLYEQFIYLLITYFWLKFSSKSSFDNLKSDVFESSFKFVFFCVTFPIETSTAVFVKSPKVNFINENFILKV